MPSPLAKLTDFEEMLVSRIHPLIQVFTLFPSGQIAYVGHIVNFRQRSIHWVQNLPLHPNDIPIILVRRKLGRQQEFEGAGVRLLHARKHFAMHYTGCLHTIHNGSPEFMEMPVSARRLGVLSKVAKTTN